MKIVTSLNPLTQAKWLWHAKRQLDSQGEPKLIPPLTEMQPTLLTHLATTTFHLLYSHLCYWLLFHKIGYIYVGPRLDRQPGLPVSSITWASEAIQPTLKNLARLSLQDRQHKSRITVDESPGCKVCAEAGGFCCLWDLRGREANILIRSQREINCQGRLGSGLCPIVVG